MGLEDELKRLKIGDILGDGGHTMMYVGHTRTGMHCMVHSDVKNGVSCVEMNETTSDVWKDADVYRCNRPNLGLYATQYALAWACKLPDCSSVKKTHYPTTVDDDGQPINVYYGVTEESHNKRHPPFEYDVLYRAVNWAARFDETFDERFGITCCAFICACYQAGAILKWTAGDSTAAKVERIKITSGLLECMRGPQKKAQQEAYTHTTSHGRNFLITPAAFREYANREHQGMSTLDEKIVTALQFLGKYDIPKDIKAGMGQIVAGAVFTQAMVVDAKYNYTMNMEKRLKNCHDWTKTTIDLDKESSRLVSSDA